MAHDQARLQTFRILVTFATLALVLWSSLAAVSDLPRQVSDGLLEFRKGALDLELDLPSGAPIALGAALGIETGVALLASLLILALVWRAGRRPEARTLALFLLFWFLKPEKFERLVPVSSADLSYLAVGFAIAALLRFTALFPTPLGVDDILVGAAAGRRRLLGRVVDNVGVRLLARPSAAWILAGLACATLLVCSSLQVRGVGLTVCWIWVVFGVIFSLRFIRTGYSNADPPGRRRTLWVFQALNVIVWGALILILVGLPFMVIGALVWRLELGVYVFPAGAAMNLLVVVFLTLALFRDGGIDPGLVIRRTAAYGLLTIALAFVLGAVQTLVSNVVAEHLDLPVLSGTWVTRGSLALVFFPLRTWCKDRVDGYLSDRLPPTALAEGPTAEATVVFTDLVGYTRLSAEDERTALTVLSVFHKAARRAVNRQRGRLVKTIGDAVLMTFRDPIRAVRAIAELESSLVTAAEALELPQPLLRTGVHYGMITLAPDGDLFGGTVNLASRLQTSASPGEIVVSREVLEDGEVRRAFNVQSLGATSLKNIPEPVERYRVCAPRVGR